MESLLRREYSTRNQLQDRKSTGIYPRNQRDFVTYFLQIHMGVVLYLDTLKFSTLDVLTADPKEVVVLNKIG